MSRRPFNTVFAIDFCDEPESSAELATINLVIGNDLSACRSFAVVALVHAGLLTF